MPKDLRPMAVMPFEKICLFIDGANLYHTAKKLGIEIDYEKLLQYFSRDGILLRAFYYTAVSDEPQYEWLHRLITWLAENGYHVVTKRAKVYTNESEGEEEKGEEKGVHRKGNMDIELAIDLIGYADYYDRAIVFSGDGDLRRAIEVAQQKGVRVEIASIRDHVAPELRRQADRFIDLANPEIQTAIAHFK